MLDIYPVRLSWLPHLLQIAVAPYAFMLPLQAEANKPVSCKHMPSAVDSIGKLFFIAIYLLLFDNCILYICK